MPTTDLIILGIICAFALAGFFFGFIQTLGSLAGSLIAIYVANILSAPVTAIFGHYFGGGGFARVAVFSILVLLISKLIGILFWLLGKGFHFLSWIPLAKTVNRMLGAVLGMFEGIAAVAAVLFFALHYLPHDALRTSIEHSAVASFLVSLIALLTFLFPQAMKAFLP